MGFVVLALSRCSSSPGRHGPPVLSERRKRVPQAPRGPHSLTRSTCPTITQLLLRTSSTTASVGSLISRVQIPAVASTGTWSRAHHPGNRAIGPGHYVGTALPGYTGNVAVWTHRATFGGRLEHLEAIAPRDVMNLAPTLARALPIVFRTADRGITDNQYSGGSSGRPADAYDENSRVLSSAASPSSCRRQGVVRGPVYSGPAPLWWSSGERTDRTGLAVSHLPTAPQSIA